MTSHSKITVSSDTRSSVPQNLPSRIRRSLGSAIKMILPQPWTREIQRYRAYDNEERALYLKIRLRQGVRRPSLRRIQLPRPLRSVLFVCFGNIMRSPMCEALFNRALAAHPDLKIHASSAGLHAAPGREAHPWAVAAARELGISLDSHKAQLLNATMVEQADAIFVMDYQNLVQLLRTFPATKKEKVIMLGVFAGERSRNPEITDPYYQGQEGTRQCYANLQRCVDNLISNLASQAET